MAEEKKEPAELKCAVCGVFNGTEQEDKSITVVKLVTVISKGADEPNVSQKKLALCDECDEMGKQRILHKCIKCQRALASGFGRNAAAFEMKNDEGKTILFSFNDNLAKMLAQPVEDIGNKAVLLFINECPMCRRGCGGKCGDHAHDEHKCGGKCGGHSHDEHKCGGGRPHKEDEF